MALPCFRLLAKLIKLPLRNLVIIGLLNPLQVGALRTIERVDHLVQHFERQLCMLVVAHQAILQLGKGWGSIERVHNRAHFRRELQHWTWFVQSLHLSDQLPTRLLQSLRSGVIIRTFTYAILSSLPFHESQNEAESANPAHVPGQVPN